jgi:hypothetical protein
MKSKAKGAAAKPLDQLRQQIHNVLQNPLKVRAGVLICLWLLGYGVVFHPLQSRILAARKSLNTELARAAAADQIKELEEQAKLCHERVLCCEQFNEWAQGVIDRTRVSGLRVRNMEVHDIRKLDPYHVVAMKLELEGTYGQALDFLSWAEDPGRTNRIDVLRLKRESDYLCANLELSGLVEKIGKPDAPKEEGRDAHPI